MKRQTNKRISLLIRTPVGGRVLQVTVNEDQYTFLKELASMTKPLPGTVGPITQPYLEVLSDKHGKAESRPMFKPDNYGRSLE